MIPLVLADASSSFLLEMQKKMHDEGRVKLIVATSEIPEIELVLRKNRDAVLLIGPSYKNEDAMGIVKGVSSHLFGTGIVLLANDITTELLGDAMRAGVSDVVPSTVTVKQLLPALERAFQHSQKIKNANADSKSVVSESKSTRQRAAKVISFFSAKGGAGKTTIASNLAIGLAQKTRARVVLMDLDLQFGDVAVALQLAPERTVYDVASSMEKLDADMMEGFLASHNSGVRALLSPIQPEQAEGITGKDIERIIEVLKQAYDYLLIDTPPSFNDNVLAALDNSDEIYLITTLDLPCLKNTKLALHMMDVLQYPKEKIKLIINRANSRVRLDARDVEKALEMRASANVPSDILMPLSLNKGVPIVLDSPRSGIARSLFQLIEHMKNGSPQETKQ